MGKLQHLCAPALMTTALSFSTPYTGGTWSVFRALQEGLQPHGVALSWLAAGSRAAEAAECHAAETERYPGCVVVPATMDEWRRAQALFEEVTSSGAELVFVHVLCGKVETNLARYLPRRLRRVLVVHNITPSTYRAARAVRDYVHATVGVSPRIRDDLVRRFGFNPDWTFTVANGVNLAAFSGYASANSRRPLRILSLGRVEDISKGVMWLPGILRRTTDAGADVSLTIAGDGPDLEELKRRFQPLGLGERLRFMGRTSPDHVPSLMADHDVFLFPSRFEGLPLTLVEAMATGCVPIASRIHGVTDFVVEDGKTGLLFPVGDVRQAAGHLVRLAGDRVLLGRLRGAARESAFNRFGIERQGASYYSIIQRVLGTPRPLAEPLPLERWAIPRGLRPGWWFRLPEPAKNALRGMRERWGTRSFPRRRG